MTLEEIREATQQVKKEGGFLAANAFAQSAMKENGITAKVPQDYFFGNKRR